MTAAGAGLLEGAPDENGIENTNPGGPIGPVVIQPNINPAGSAASVPVTKPTLTPQQQFSPEYQAWLDSEPNLAKAINSLSPNGQKITNEIFNYASTHNLPSDVIKKELIKSNLTTSDKDKILGYLGSTIDNNQLNY